MDEPEILFEGRQGVSPPLPHDWMIIKQDDALFLLCGEQIAIELKTGRSKIPAPDNLQSEYQRRKPSPEHFVEDSFVLNEYQVRHKGECTSARRTDRISGRSAGAGICTPTCSARATTCISGQPELAAIFTF